MQWNVLLDELPHWSLRNIILKPAFLARCSASRGFFFSFKLISISDCANAVDAVIVYRRGKELRTPTPSIASISARDPSEMRSADSALSHSLSLPHTHHTYNMRVLVYIRLFDSNRGPPMLVSAPFVARRRNIDFTFRAVRSDSSDRAKWLIYTPERRLHSCLAPSPLRGPLVAFILRLIFM